MRPVNRLEAKLPAAAMKTYQILAPVVSHFRSATCAEVDCERYTDGWQSPIDERTELGQAQAWYIRNQSGRRYTEDRNRLPGITVFTFEPGQKCFGQHQVRTGRPELFIVRGGDWRGNPTGQTQMHANGDDWVDDFVDHQLKLANQIQQG